MAEQEPMTQDPGRPRTEPRRAEQRQAARTSCRPAHSATAPLGWFRRLSRRGRLAVTGSAAVLAVVAALLALGATSGGHARSPP